MGRDEALTWAETQNPLEEQAEASRLWPGLFRPQVLLLQPEFTALCSV